MKFGIIGFGFMGKTFVHSVNCLEDFYKDVKKPEIAGVIASSKKSLQNIDLARYGIKHAYDNIESMLQDESIDSVYIASPNNLHSEHIKKCLLSQKNILCDKPLVSPEDDSSDILDLIDKNKIFQMLFEYRNIPAIREMREIIKKNKIGKIINFRFNYLHSGYLDPNRPMSWRLRKGGGAFFDLGPHVIDLINFLLEDIKTIHGIKKTHFGKRPRELNAQKKEFVHVDDFAMGICETISGINGFIEVSRLSMGSMDDLNIHISGEKGALKWNLEDLDHLIFSTNNGTNRIRCENSITSSIDFPPSKVSHGWLRAHCHSVYQFVKQVSSKNLNKSERECIPNFYDGLKVQKILSSFKQIKL